MPERPPVVALIPICDEGVLACPKIRQSAMILAQMIKGICKLGSYSLHQKKVYTFVEAHTLLLSVPPQFGVLDSTKVSWTL